MKRIVLVLLVGVVNSQVPKEKMDWEKFKETYNKNYITEGEESRRRLAFESNVQLIDKQNKEYELGLHSYRMSINEFTDLSNKAFTYKFTGYYKLSNQSGNIFSRTHKNLPTTVDWRIESIVTQVKHQFFDLGTDLSFLGRCLSSWAFSATGSLEGQHALATGELVALNEIQLLLCSSPQGNQRCCGGEMHRAFEYIIKNGGIFTTASYNMFSEDICSLNISIGATMKSYEFIPTTNESALQEAVATIGPISAAIDASQSHFQFYSDGIYDNENCSSTKVNHAVLVVGYGTEDGKDYWLVKNSWGTDWGEEGYVKMARNKNNQCGLATSAVYPIV